MASAAFWNWVNSQGLIPQSDPNYYASGQAAKDPNAYAHALRTAITNVKTKTKAIQDEFFAKLKAEGGMSAESSSGYYSTIAADSAGMANLVSAAASAFNAAYGTGSTSQAIPRDAKLVRIGNTYRVVWDLGEGLGHAWYSISPTHLKNLYGSETPAAHFNLSNIGQFDERFKAAFWGDASEISLKAETPWQDMRDRIFSQFGFVPGFDTPDVRRLLLQSFWEGWTQDQFTVEYRKTPYYTTTTDQQRQWAGLSPTEQSRRINEVQTNLANAWRDIYGSTIQFSHLTTAARSIASGVLNQSQWEYEQRQAASGMAGTPEYARRAEQQRAAAEAINLPENLALFAENQYRSWVGPGALPANFAQTWGRNLASGKSSEADLENYLKSLSQGQWAFKDPNLRWEDWAAGYKAQISDTLELGSISDKDPLLGRILRTDLTGTDLETMIRSDQRFRSTQRMFAELSSGATEIGRRFGFIT